MNSSLPKNLHLLCQYVPSITRVASDLKMNRQQFYRYLNGQSEPPLRKLRAMADYFGLEESEMLLPHEEFRTIVAVRGVDRILSDPFAAHVSDQFNVNPTTTKKLRPLLGHYYVYVRAAEVGGKVNRSLLWLTEKDGFIRTKSLENYAKVEYRNRRILKYRGFAYTLGQELYVHERELFAGRMSWNTVLGLTDNDQFSIYSGLTLGVTSANQRVISAYRIIWQKIPEGTPLRQMIANCGIYDPDSDQISDSVRNAIINDVREDEIGFAARPWRMSVFR